MADYFKTENICQIYHRDGYSHRQTQNQISLLR